MLRGASKHKKKRKTTSVWPGSQWSKSEIRCESRNIMRSAKWAKLSWQDKVGSGLTLIYGVVLKHSFGAGWRGDTGGLQTHCKFLLDWSEQTALETSLRYQAKHVESPFLFQTLDPRSWSQCTPRDSVSVFISCTCSPAWLPCDYICIHLLNFARVDFFHFSLPFHAIT